VHSARLRPILLHCAGALCHYERMTTTGNANLAWYQRADVLFAIALGAEIGATAIDVARAFGSPGVTGVGVLGFVLLFILRLGRDWAWWGYVAISLINFALIALIPVLLALFPSAEAEISWPGLALSAVALAAVLAPPLRPVNVRRRLSETE
jgi:hypothetical protein